MVSVFVITSIFLIIVMIMIWKTSVLLVLALYADDRIDQSHVPELGLL